MQLRHGHVVFYVFNLFALLAATSSSRSDDVTLSACLSVTLFFQLSTLHLRTFAPLRSCCTSRNFFCLKSKDLSLQLCNFATLQYCNFATLQLCNWLIFILFRSLIFFIYIIDYVTFPGNWLIKIWFKYLTMLLFNATGSCIFCSNFGPCYPTRQLVDIYFVLKEHNV